MKIEFTTEPGWIGAFTRAQADDAAPNGTRVVKANSKPGDAHQDGAPATVLGSFADPASGVIAYFVEWDDAPHVACGLSEHRMRVVKG